MQVFWANRGSFLCKQQVFGACQCLVALGQLLALAEVVVRRRGLQEPALGVQYPHVGRLVLHLQRPALQGRTAIYVCSLIGRLLVHDHSVVVGGVLAVSVHAHGSSEP